MKNFYICILFVLIPLCINKTISSWKLSIKDENSQNSIINLFPGIFTKVTLVLSNENDEEVFDDSENPISFKISLKNKNLVSISSSYTLVPSESLVYEVYVGLKCGETLADTKSLFKLDSTDGDATLTIGGASLKVSTEKAKIDIEPLMNEIAEQSYDVFRVNKEPYNIEKIKLIPKIDGDNGDFTFDEITLDKYDGVRGEYSPLNTLTNGILNKFKFGTKKLFEKLSKTSVKFDLTFESEDLGKCFDLVKKSFDLKVIQKKVEKIGENVKKAISYTLENLSPLNEMTNSLELKLSIPLAPIAVTCEFKADAYFSKSDDDIINHANASATYYDNVFTSTGDVTLKIGNLNSSMEYYSKCVFSNTGFLDELKQKISVTIGNFLDSDVISKLKPSRDTSRPPQCVKFVFSNILKAAFYTTILPKYCRFAMKKGMPIVSGIFSDVVCTLGDMNFGLLSENYINICVAPSPILSVNRLISQMTPEQYNKNFEQFINDVKDKNILGSNIVKSATRYYDVVPDTSKISFSVSKNIILSNSLIGTVIDVSAKSTNEAPIECFYNSDLSKDNTKKFSLLGLLTIHSVILNPNEEQDFKIYIKPKYLEEGKMYPFYMQCYSLPRAIYRYETTGLFNAYTYLNDKSITNQNAQKSVQIKIDCNIIENKMNPHCIKISINSLIEKIRTDIPIIIKNIEGQVECFKKLAEDAQLSILKNLNTTLKNVISEVKKSEAKLKSFIEKGIETAKYLANKDCSIYASGETSDEGQTYKAGLYLECRNTKKHILSQLMGTIQEKLQCSKIVEVITSNLSDDAEQNLKYILFLINEITNNPDALEEGYNQVIYDLTNCLQEKFDEYWPKIEKYLQEKKSYLKQSILAVKKDVSNILMQTISNLVNVLHFEEIDGHIQQAKEEIKKNGLIALDKAKKINKNIFNFIKKLNEFGSNYYNISGSMGVNVTVNPGQLDASSDAKLFVSDLKDKGIKILLHSNYMLRDKGAYAMQTVVFDSPLVSVNAKNEVEDGTINTFVGITLYDKDGKEIAVSNMKLEDFRPQILYNKKLYSAMKTCFFYNENDEKLDDDGVETDDNYVLDGESYIRCIPKHLTSFTIGSGEGSSSNVGTIILIVVLCLLVIVALVVAFIILRKKFSNKVTNSDIESQTPDSNGINA